MTPQIFKHLLVFLFVGILLPATMIAEAVPMGPVMCACPGRHKPKGSAATCEEACYGSRSGGSGAGSGSSPGTELGEALAPFIQQGIEDLFKGPDPAEVQRRQEEAARRAEEARLAAIEKARLDKIKNDQLDQQANGLLGLAAPPPKIMDDDELLRDAPANTSPSPTPKPWPVVPRLSRANFARQGDKSSGKPPVARVPCIENDANQFFCSEKNCGGADGLGACCPKTHPYLSHCDCLCYVSNYDIKTCSAYSGCQYTWTPK